MVDEINFGVMEAVRALKPGTVVLDTWWSRWGYVYYPDFIIYDVITKEDRLEIGRSNQYDRVPEASKVIDLTDAVDVVILIRPDHPDKKAITQQVMLTPLDPWIGVHRVHPIADTLRWKDRLFRFGER
jgi:hypothetical protein